MLRRNRHLHWIALLLASTWSVLAHRLVAAAAAPLVDPDPSAAEAAEAEAVLAERVRAFFQAYVNASPILTSDGRLVFASNRDGLPQLYVADAGDPASPARRLVSSSERISSPTATADGRGVVYRSDRGADENWSIFRVELDGGDPIELTPGETLQRDPPVEPAGVPGTLYYSARRLSEAASAVYAARSDRAAPPRLVYRDPRPGVLTDVSSDGRWGLFVAFPSHSDNQLLVIDLRRGRAQAIYPLSGQASISDAELSPDGRRAYVATDGGGEQALLLALDARSGREQARYVETQPPTALLGDVEVSPRGDVVAVDLAAGERGDVRLLDARALRRLADVALPLGTGGLGRFSRDGAALSLVWSVPASPTDIYRVDVATGGLRPLREDPRPALAGWSPPEVASERIPAHDGGFIQLNVYRPSEAAKRRLPVIVSYHGGPAGVSQFAWSAGRAFFLSQGYAWVEPNVRGSAGFGRAFEEADNGPRRWDALRDVETSARWVAAQEWADPERLVIYGGSYGGYTTLIGLTRQPEIWRAGVDLFGVADMHTFMASTSGVIRQVFLVEFGDPEKDATLLTELSPLRDAERIVDPLFVYAGANDPRVPRSESDLIVRALRERRVPVEYMVKENEGHSVARLENQVELFARVARFLERHLR